MASNNESMFVCFYRSYFWLFLTSQLHILSVILLFRIEKLPGFSKWLTLVRVFVLVQNVFHISIANISDSCKNCRIKGYFIHVMITSRTSRTHGLHLHLISRFFFLFWYGGEWQNLVFLFFRCFVLFTFFWSQCFQTFVRISMMSTKDAWNKSNWIINLFHIFWWTHSHTLWWNEFNLFGKAFESEEKCKEKCPYLVVRQTEFFFISKNRTEDSHLCK